MRHPRESHEPFSPFCAQLGDEDGEDPHLLKRRVSRARKGSSQPARARRTERKACQLCRQVAETLDEVLADCGDEILRGLRVTSAVPYPDASRLLVTVAPVDGRLAPASGPSVVIEHLERASGHLRFEIAAAVTRKRAPLLLYRLAEPALAVFEP
jgi:ribosome-binding factor A